MDQSQSAKDEEDYDLSSLFTNQDYVEKVFSFLDVDQKLLCSAMSSTDFDLTGQIVWPASVLLSWFIHSKQEEIFQGKTVLELGAGCGLGGFFASKFAKRCIITDGNDIVVDLLNKNKNHLSEDTAKIGHEIQIKKLVWGFKNEVSAIITEECNHDLDVIIGADIILWPQIVYPLVQTLRWLLSFKPNTCQAYISYVVRAKSTTALFYETIQKFGLSIESVDPLSFLPNPTPNGLDNTPKFIFRIWIQNTEGVSFDTEPEESIESERTFITTNNAC